MKIRTILALLVALSACSDDEPILVSFEIDEEIECPEAKVTRIDDDYVDCFWPCATYDGETEQTVSISFSKDEAGEWSIQSESTSDAHEALCD